jgi:2-desacetyl-2-hydroxyethyl bacteriochlorophyllide A dehydrogenase
VTAVVSGPEAELALSRGRLAVTSRERRQLGPNEIRIAVAYAGICGTDLHAIEAADPADERPLVLGHEYSGRVVETGADVAAVSVGDRVVGRPRIPCGRCAFCNRGRAWDCADFRRPPRGAWATTIVVDERFALPIPNQLGLREAALAEPLASALRAIDIAAPGAGHRALVLGGGPIGLAAALLAASTGAVAVLVSEPNPYRRDVAAGLGFDVCDPTTEDLVACARELTGGLGFDVVYEAVGSSVTVESAVACAGRGGAVVVLGVAPRDARARLSPFELFAKELRLAAAWASETTLARALDLIVPIGADRLITHVLDLRDGVRAVELARSGEGVKVLLQPAPESALA